MLPILDTGEALVVGDACLLPARIRIAEPKYKPNSGTIEFWDRWSSNDCMDQVATAVKRVPLASTAVIVTTAPTLNVGKVIVMLDGDVAITAVAGMVPEFDDEST